MFGPIFGFLVVASIYVLVGIAVLWFLRALNNIAIGLREVAERLSTLEAAVRQGSARITT